MTFSYWLSLRALRRNRTLQGEKRQYQAAPISAAQAAGTGTNAQSEGAAGLRGHIAFAWMQPLIPQSLFPVFLTLNHTGVPANPKASRIWFSRKRSKAKCSFTSRSVKSTNVGGATAAWVM